MGKKVGTLCALLIAFSFILNTGNVFAETKTSDKNDAALVNGTPIPMEELDRAVNLAVQRSQKTGKPIDKAQIDKLKNDILDRLIGAELLYQAAVQEGIKISEKEQNDKFDQWKKGFPSEDAFKSSLKQWNIDEATMRKDLEKAMTIEEFIKKKFADKIAVPESEVKEYYDSHPEFFKQPEQVKASHILIKVEPDAKEEDKAAALKKIKDVQGKLKEGAKFDALAKEYSEGPSKDKGGDLGYFRRGQMVKPFEEKAFALKPGEVSDIVETQFGYHLIEVVDVKPASVVPFSEVKDRIQKFLQQQKTQTEMFAFIAELRKAAKVETFLKTGS